MALLFDIIDVEPSIYTKVVEKKVWKYAMFEEYQLIMKNDVWDVVPRQEGKLVVTFKWIYNINHATYGSIEKYKARFVAHGFSYKEEIYYQETFTPIARYTYIRAIMVLATKMGWKLH